jgi:hypothetical protein
MAQRTFDDLPLHPIIGDYREDFRRLRAIIRAGNQPWSDGLGQKWRQILWKNKTSMRFRTGNGLS